MFIGLTEVAGGFQKTLMRMIGGLGEMVWAQWEELRYAAAVIGTVLYICVRPRYWVRTVRRAFVRQVVAIGVDAVGLVCGVAVFVGLTVVVQLAFWVAEAGQSQMLGPLLVAVVARELAAHTNTTVRPGHTHGLTLGTAVDVDEAAQGVDTTAAIAA